MPSLWRKKEAQTSDDQTAGAHQNARSPLHLGHPAKGRFSLSLHLLGTQWAPWKCWCFLADTELSALHVLPCDNTMRWELLSLLVCRWNWGSGTHRSQQQSQDWSLGLFHTRDWTFSHYSMQYFSKGEKKTYCKISRILLLSPLFLILLQRQDNCPWSGSLLSSL